MRWFVFFLLPFVATAQKTDLYLFDISISSENYEVSNPRFLSDFNRGGYTNQPFFYGTDEMLVSVGPAEDPGQTDLYKLNTADFTYTRLTQTPDREYSPQISPDPAFMSCVLVEAEQQDNQVLWSYPTDLNNGGKRLLSQVRNVGYYCFLDDPWIAIFEVDSVNALYLYNTETGDKEFVSDHIGRSLHRMEDGSLAFVHKHSDDYWFLKKKMPGSRSEIIKKTIPNAEDFILLPDGSILMGKESTLYHLDPNGENLWKEVSDLSSFGIKNITRLAYNGRNKLALVDQK